MSVKIKQNKLINFVNLKTNIVQKDMIDKKKLESLAIAL